MNNWKSTRSTSAFPIAVSCVLIVLTGILAAFVFHTESIQITSMFERFTAFLFTSVAIFLSFMWLLMLLYESFDRSFGKLYKPAKWFLFFVYYPLARIIAVLFRFTGEDIQTSFLEFQNRMFLANSRLNGQSRLLLLLPHCLQFHDCKIRITRDINSCEDCGECDICNLKDLGKRFDMNIGIANGGTLARKIVNDIQPDAIIAVACHRDLTDGVRESWKFPVYAILNERPFGPCYDTRVETEKIESILKLILS